MVTGKFFVQPWEDRPPPPAWTKRRTSELSASSSKQRLSGSLRAISHRGMKKPCQVPHPPAGTPPYSAMKWHPYLINCESWKFCTRDSFSLHLTVIELHSHAISFTMPMRRKESGGGGCVPVCERALRGRTRHHGSVLNGTATGQHSSP